MNYILLFTNHAAIVGFLSQTEALDFFHDNKSMWEEKLSLSYQEKESSETEEVHILNSIEFRDIPKENLTLYEKYSFTL